MGLGPEGVTLLRQYARRTTPSCGLCRWARWRDSLSLSLWRGSRHARLSAALRHLPCREHGCSCSPNSLVPVVRREGASISQGRGSPTFVLMCSVASIAAVLLMCSVASFAAVLLMCIVASIFSDYCHCACSQAFSRNGLGCGRG